MFGPTPTREEHKDIGKMEVMFKLQPPSKTVAEGTFIFTPLICFNYLI